MTEGPVEVKIDDEVIVTRTVRGKVTGTLADRFYFRDNGILRLLWSMPYNDEHFSVEVVKPPVHVFGPGDIVRALGSGNSHLHFIIAKTGYFDVGNGIFNSWNEYLRSDCFTSDTYELVKSL